MSRKTIAGVVVATTPPECGDMSAVATSTVTVPPAATASSRRRSIMRVGLRSTLATVSRSPGGSKPSGGFRRTRSGARSSAAGGRAALGRVRLELQGERVDAVPHAAGILRAVGEHVPQVRAAALAGDLGAVHPMRAVVDQVD